MNFILDSQGYICCFCQKPQKRLIGHLVTTSHSKCKGKIKQVESLKLSFERFRNKMKKSTFKEKHPEDFAAQHRKHQETYKQANPDKFAAQHRQHQRTYIATRSEQESHKRFLEATMYGADFPCVCCHERKFKDQVKVFDKDLMRLIGEKSPGVLYRCADNNHISSIHFLFLGVCSLIQCP